MDPKDIATRTFQERFGESPRYLALAPGRVNLLGEHVDYNDGFVFPAAIDRATYLAFSPNEDGASASTLVAADLREETTFDHARLGEKTDPNGKPLPEWAHYPAGVAWALQEEGLATPAIRGAFASSVPRGAGLSSSASVEMAFAVAWQTLGGWNLPPMKRALLGQKAENRYVGVNCGIMDQFASACGVAGGVLALDCRSLSWETFRLPEDIAIVIADTTVRRKLTDGTYNRRRKSCEDAVKILSRDLPGINSLRDVRVEDFRRLKANLPPEDAQRAQHVVEEIDRSMQAMKLLERGAIDEFGRIMNACHASLRDLYEVSIPELDAMAEIAQTLPGCKGARLTGAGFGGCTVNLVEQKLVEPFVTGLSDKYKEKTGLTAEIYICHASEGARLL